MPVPLVTVRPIAASDAAAVISLLAELGYAADERGLRARIPRATRRAAELVLVAEVAGRVVACMSLTFAPYFPDGSFLCRITALVVGSSHRGRGIGAVLIARAVDEARRAGCSTVEVTSAERRLDAHRFYEREGFTRTSCRFTRAL